MLTSFLSDNAKIGVVLIALGLGFLGLGMLLFFDGALLTIGNILLLAGFPFILGFSRTLVFFNPFSRSRDKAMGVMIFAAGLILVLFLRWAVIGMLLEIVGLFYMFRSFIPHITTFLSSMPVIGPLFQTESVKSLVDMLKVKGGELPTKRPQSRI